MINVIQTATLCAGQSSGGARTVRLNYGQRGISIGRTRLWRNGGGWVTKATAIPFNEQVAIFCREVSKVFDYVALDDFYRAKFAIYDGDWSPANIAEVLMRANYNGAIARIAYYKYVHQRGFDARALWDALILTWMMNGVWSFDLDRAIKEPEFKAVLKRFRYPEWVKFGLIGGGLDELKRMGDEFCVEMEAI